MVFLALQQCVDVVYRYLLPSCSCRAAVPHMLHKQRGVYLHTSTSLQPQRPPCWASGCPPMVMAGFCLRLRKNPPGVLHHASFAAQCMSPTRHVGLQQPFVRIVTFCTAAQLLSVHASVLGAA